MAQNLKRITQTSNSKAWLPDAQLRQKVRQMKEAEAKAQVAMKRAGDWPAWMDEE